MTPKADNRLIPLADMLLRIGDTLLRDPERVLDISDEELLVLDDRAPGRMRALRWGDTA